MAQKLISIVIPVYKVEKELSRCLNSILNQTYEKLEIILVDDGSPDNSGRLCDEFASKDNRIKVFHIENGGAARARNIGLAVATGEYIGFVDSDDYIDTNMYEIMINAIEENGADISAVGIIREDEASGSHSVIRTPNQPTVYSDEDTLREILRSRYVGSSVWSKLYRRECWEDVRFPEGQTNEDIKIIFELHRGRKLVHTAIPTYHYMVRENSVTAALSLKDLQIAMNNAALFIEKAKGFSAELVQDAVFYQTCVARDCLFILGDGRQDSNIYKKCRQIYNSNWMMLKVGVKEILLRGNLYHFVKRFFKK